MARFDLLIIERQVATNMLFELLYSAGERFKRAFFISNSKITVEDSRIDNTLPVAVRTFNRSFQPFLAKDSTFKSSIRELIEVFPENWRSA